VTDLPDQLAPPRLDGAARQLVRADDIEAAAGLPARQTPAVRAQVTQQPPRRLSRIHARRYAARLAGHQPLAHTASQRRRTQEPPEPNVRTRRRDALTATRARPCPGRTNGRSHRPAQ
jgi:hypothetical protein